MLRLQVTSQHHQGHPPVIRYYHPSFQHLNQQASHKTSSLLADSSATTSTRLGNYPLVPLPSWLPHVSYPFHRLPASSIPPSSSLYPRPLLLDRLLASKQQIASPLTPLSQASPHSHPHKL